MIQSNRADPQSPQFRVLSDEQCSRLFDAAKECLQRVGVLVQNSAARDLLLRHGATAEDAIVHIPAKLVENAIASTPHEFTVWGRDDANAMQISAGRVHFGPGPTCTYFVDPETGQRRKAHRGDAGLTALVCDALPNLDYVMGLSLFDDVTPVLSSVYEFAEELANTAKPIVAWANSPAAFMDIYRMARAVAGGDAALRAKPPYAYFTTYESPLKLADAPLENLMQAAALGVPGICLGGPTVGLESPFTGASALVLYLSAALAALTVVQLCQPGASMAIGGLPSMMDLRTGRPAYGSPEASLHTAAAADLAHFLGIPFMGTAAASEAKRLDAQAGTEAALQVILSALSGASLVHDVGFLDCADIGSLEYLVLADEIIGMARRVMRGIQVEPDTIMLDLIAQVGPGGLFLRQGKSSSMWRQEVWMPTVLDRNPYATWERQGALSTADVVGAKLKRILTTHHPLPLPVDVSREIEKTLALAENREGQKQAR